MYPVCQVSYILKTYLKVVLLGVNVMSTNINNSVGVETSMLVSHCTVTPSTLYVTVPCCSPCSLQDPTSRYSDCRLTRPEVTARYIRSNPNIEPQ